MRYEDQLKRTRVSSYWREKAEHCRRDAVLELGAYPVTDYLKAAKLLDAAHTFEKEATRVFNPNTT